jgi:hypothetical protein
MFKHGPYASAGRFPAIERRERADAPEPHRLAIPTNLSIA